MDTYIRESARMCFDPAAAARALAGAVRAGIVSRERAAYAAALGHPAAQAVVAPADRPELPIGRWGQAHDGAVLLSQPEAVIWAADCAADALQNWHGADRRPDQAIAAARAWAAYPCDVYRADAAACIRAGYITNGPRAAVNAAAAAASADCDVYAIHAANAASNAAYARTDPARTYDATWERYIGWLADRLVTPKKIAWVS